MSEYKKTMIDSIHRFHRKDLWVNELFDSFTADMENVDDKLQQDYNNLFFDRLDERACEVYEKDLALTPKRNSTLDDRRRNIAAAWLAKTFASLPVIQSIAEAFYEDAVKVTYDGDAELTFNFTNTLGTNPWYKMLEAVDKIKPAHIDTKIDAKLNIETQLFAGIGLAQSKKIKIDLLHVQDTERETQLFAGIGVFHHKKVELLPVCISDVDISNNVFAGASLAINKKIEIQPVFISNKDIPQNAFIGTVIEVGKKIEVSPDVVQDSAVAETSFIGTIIEIGEKIEVLPQFAGDNKITEQRFTGNYIQQGKNIKVLPLNGN